MPVFLQHHPILKVRSDGQAEEELGIYLWQDHMLIARIAIELTPHYHAQFMASWATVPVLAGSSSDLATVDQRESIMN